MTDQGYSGRFCRCASFQKSLRSIVEILAAFLWNNSACNAARMFIVMLFGGKIILSCTGHKITLKYDKVQLIKAIEQNCIVFDTGKTKTNP